MLTPSHLAPGGAGAGWLSPISPGETRTGLCMSRARMRRRRRVAYVQLLAYDRELHITGEDLTSASFHAFIFLALVATAIILLMSLA